MEEKKTVNKRDSTTIRAGFEARERINKMAEKMGMSQEKFVDWMAKQMEDSLHNRVDSGKRFVDNQSQSVDINNNDLLLEIKAVKKVVYRMIKEHCRITDADVRDPDSGITMRARYDDQLLHPEKYRRRYTSTFGKGK